MSGYMGHLYWYCSECRLKCINPKGGWAAQLMANYNSDKECLRCKKRGVALFGYREILMETMESRSTTMGIYGVPRSRRPCNLTEGCTGSMAAMVRKHNASYTTLMWSCETCKVTHITTAKRVVASTAATALAEEQDEADRLAAALIADSSGGMSELQEMSTHIRSVMHEQPPGDKEE